MYSCFVVLPQQHWRTKRRTCAKKKGASVKHATSFSGPSVHESSGRSSTRERELWKTDGTVEGTFQVLEGHLTTQSIVGVDDHHLYFANGDDPWSVDESGNTRMLAEDVAGTSGGVAHHGDFYFPAVNESTENRDTGNEVWKTDGTNAELIADFLRSNVPERLAVNGDALYFVRCLDTRSGPRTVGSPS